MINLGKSAGKPLADKLGFISVKQLETQNIRFFGEFFTFIITCILRRPFKYGEIVRNGGYKSDWIDFWTKTISLLPLSVFPTWILTTKHPLMSVYCFFVG